jgi:hypothetical protein
MSAERQLFVVILGVLSDAQPNLLEVGLAGRTAGIFAGTGKHREQNSREYCYYSYDDQEFYECEATVLFLRHFSSKRCGKSLINNAQTIISSARFCS